MDYLQFTSPTSIKVIVLYTYISRGDGAKTHLKCVFTAIRAGWTKKALTTSCIIICAPVSSFILLFPPV
jgi:hypothetical protein